MERHRHVAALWAIGSFLVRAPEIVHQIAGFVSFPPSIGRWAEGEETFVIECVSCCCEERSAYFQANFATVE